MQPRAKSSLFTSTDITSLLVTAVFSVSLPQICHSPRVRRRRVSLHLLLQWTAHSPAPSVQYVSVNLRRAHIRVPEQFLYRSQVVAVFEQVRGETVPERVAAAVLRDPCQPHRPPHLTLHTVGRGVVAPRHAPGRG